jgi:hypothetical protein
MSRLKVHVLVNLALRPHFFVPNFPVVLRAHFRRRALGQAGKGVGGRGINSWVFIPLPSIPLPKIRDDLVFYTNVI